MYESTDLTVKEICARTGDSPTSFVSYLCRTRRDLVLKRHRLEGMASVKLRGAKGQSTAAHLKYRDAVEAAGSLEYIEFNMSQLARIFGVDPTGLANQLRRHYPDVLPFREAERRRLGISNNVHHGIRPQSEKAYVDAVELLRSSDITLEEAALACGVKLKGLRDHMRFYHQDLIGQRECRRRQAADAKVQGKRTGSWTVHRPRPEAAAKYAPAVELYRTTSMGFAEIAARLGLNKNSLRHYLHLWHPDLIAGRRKH